MSAPDPDHPEFVYDEFGFLHENCEEYGLEHDPPVAVERVQHPLDDGRHLSALRWGVDDEVDVVLVHGGAQNAHTWDTVALGLRPRSVLAVDLPGHGSSSWREDQQYDPVLNAADVAAIVEQRAPRARLVVGMSLGGLTVSALAAARPDLATSVVLVDITPGVTRDKASEVHAFIEGPQTFASFGEIFDRTVEFNPTRTPESLRRGILHNAHRNPDGTWEWNYDRRPLMPRPDGAPGPEYLWDAIGSITAPLLLVRGADSPVVDDDDVAELKRRKPDARVVVVDGAGHSVQGDRPIELRDLLVAELTQD
jgi:pimeloyl-ACP methyl ester carboxylesterase